MHFEDRHQVAEYAAQQAEGGVIVEIGGGAGAVALVNGTRCGRNLPVYVIAPGPDLEEILQARGYSERVQTVKQDAPAAARDWDKPIALLWLDASLPPEEAQAILSAWEPFVIEGGLAAGPGQQQALPSGWRRELAEQDMVDVARKTTLRRAVFYLCNDGDGGRFVREAVASAASAKRRLGLPCHLFLQGKTGEDVSVFDSVTPLPALGGPFWYLDSTRHFVDVVGRLANYDQLLYLDVDTHVCEPCTDIFMPLDRFDMLFGLSASRDAIESALGTPASFPTPQIGVNVFNNTPRVRAFLAYWLALYEEHYRTYDNNDEAPMRDALYAYDDIRVGPLAPEYCLRFDFGAWIVGKVRILHGRNGGISIDRRPLEDVARAINERTSMRQWRHGALIEPSE